MNHNSSTGNPNFDIHSTSVSQSQTANNTASIPHSGIHGTPQSQKRQNSLSSYMIGNSNKRTPNQVTMEYAYGNNSNGGNGNNSTNPNSSPALANAATASSRYANSPLIRNSVRRNLLQQQQISANSSNNNAYPSNNNIHMKTPTPSAYEVPSSPTANPLSHVSAQVHSDSSDSNPMDEQQAQQNQQNQQSQQQLGHQSQLESQPHKSQNQAQSHHNQNQQIQNASSQQQTDQSQRTMSDEEQQLANKLKETYKNIVNFEEIVQKNCIEITIKINQITSNNNNNSLVYGNAPLLNQQQQQNQLSSSLSSNINASNPSSSASRTSELSNDLWTVYHHNITLLDNYYDFLVTALKPSSNQTQFKTGKNIVELYKIPRRMWVYGIVGFLEVLKNIMGIFQDHEICSCFISHCFNIISNLTDPVLEMEGWWSEKLGDLSRMAIALYASKFIDWKISAEYWYASAMRTFYGHGKIYYHMCTVQQDNLDALVNIGKSVICRDPFVPTQHYLRLVVENICTQRNILSLLELPIIDFIKIHKVLLSIHGSSVNNNSANNGGSNSDAAPDSIQGSQLQYGMDLVTRYGLTFGSDSNGYNFFTRELYTPSGVTSINDPHHPYYLSQSQSQLQQHQPSATNTIEKMNFWFNKGSLFAIANINHLVGFGDARNPFAKLFQLPEALKERKDKKDRKRKSRTSSQVEDNPSSISNALAGNVVSSGTPLGTSATSGGVDGQTVTATDLSSNDWFYCLQFINKSVLELSIRILNHYLVGPKQASTGHVIVWLYFLISVGEAKSRFPKSAPMFGWLFKKLFPWESLINYLNALLSHVKNSPRLRDLATQYILLGDYVQHFNENEFLPEVWKCWGTLWFDCISEKTDYNDVESAGVRNNNLFDLPACGTYPVVTTTSDSDAKSRNTMESENDERIVRIVLLARVIAEKYSDFGLIRTADEFKFDETAYNTTDSSVPTSENRQNDPYAYMEEFLLSDGRFIQNNFLQAISLENLANRGGDGLTCEQKDSLWFGGYSGDYNPDNLELGQEMGNLGEMDDIEAGDFAGAEFEDQYEQAHKMNFQQQLQNQQLSQQQLQSQQSLNDFYNVMGASDPMSDIAADSDRASIDGNLGDRMDTNVTHITLDTNIWLKHCGRVFKCVRNGVFKISIPLIVFQELRALRKSTEATIADAATRSVIIIRELYLAKEILPLRFDGTVASDINETTEFENNSNWRSSVDETILNSVNEHDVLGKKLMRGMNIQLSQHRGRSSEDDSGLAYKPAEPIYLSSKASKFFQYCILITDDRNMRLRAKTIGLTSFQSRWLFSQLESLFPSECID
ncbi:uncharacterized protein RJT20DRAFT_98107 [Scheffersomyces xylosifermentans]|uniref:uncharacterized protein n=1 Tax=Scheffersomyces xylosifermentans TaxID=1304137 RepID=UPI00315D4897